MHPNYRNSFAREAFISLPQCPILSNRLGGSACALREAGDSDVLMR